MAFFKASKNRISTNITTLSYQYGHGWQRGRKYTSKRGYRVISCPYLSEDVVNEYDEYFHSGAATFLRLNKEIYSSKMNFYVI